MGGTNDDEESGIDEDDVIPSSGGGLSVPNPEVIRQFSKAPVAFILGAILNPLLTSFENAVTAVVDAIALVIVGDSLATTEGQLGLADLPMWTANQLTTGGDKIGSPVLDTVATLRRAGIALAENAGMLEPVVLAAEVAVVLAVLFFVGRTAIRVTLDVIPGLGGLL